MARIEGKEGRGVVMGGGEGKAGEGSGYGWRRREGRG